LKTVCYQKRHIQRSIGRPIDLGPAPPVRVTKLMKTFSASGLKDIVDVGDDGLKWELNESPDIFFCR
jgi:hypothetical protein